MDVRCEKCMTVYEFDDSKVGEQGVTVKCTQCGNLFKVKRRERTAELALGAAAARSPAYVPPAANVPSTQRTTVPGIPIVSRRRRTAAAHRRRSRSGEPSGWMIRVRSGEIYRFRELTTLQQWIVERKVTREDEISRSGDQWKRLGGIAELASFFHIVEQAAAVARADGPQAAAAAANAAYARKRDDDDPALVTTAPMAREPSGPIAMGNPLADDDPAFARTNPTPKLTPAASMSGGGRRRGRHAPRRRIRRPSAAARRLVGGLLAALVLLGAGGYLAAFKRDARARAVRAQGRARRGGLPAGARILPARLRRRLPQRGGGVRARPRGRRQERAAAGRPRRDDDHVGGLPARRRARARDGRAVGDGGGGGQDAAARLAGAPRRGEEVRAGRARARSGGARGQPRHGRLPARRRRAGGGGRALSDARDRQGAERRGERLRRRRARVSRGQPGRGQVEADAGQHAQRGGDAARAVARVVPAGAHRAAGGRQGGRQVAACRRCSRPTPTTIARGRCSRRSTPTRRRRRRRRRRDTATAPPPPAAGASRRAARPASGAATAAARRSRKSRTTTASSSRRAIG